MRLPLAEIEHRLSSAPPYPTRGHVWRTLVAAFWRGDLQATNWTPERLRETANLNSLPFERIATQMARRSAYSRQFQKRYLDELLFDFAEAEQCVSGARPTQASERPSDDKRRQRYMKVLAAGRERIERGGSCKSVAGWLFQQHKNEGFPKGTLEKILCGTYSPMKRLGINGLKGKRN